MDLETLIVIENGDVFKVVMELKLQGFVIDNFIGMIPYPKKEFDILSDQQKNKCINRMT